MGPIWGPLGFYRPQMGPMFAPGTLLWGEFQPKVTGWSISLKTPFAVDRLILPYIQILQSTDWVAPHACHVTEIHVNNNHVKFTSSQNGRYYQASDSLILMNSKRACRSKLQWCFISGCGIFNCIFPLLHIRSSGSNHHPIFTALPTYPYGFLAEIYRYIVWV